MAIWTRPALPSMPLQAANPRQWIVLTTEEAIAANNDPETTLALAALATALKLQSGLINDFAARNGLIAAPPTALPTVATVALAPTPAPTQLLHLRWLWLPVTCNGRRSRRHNCDDDVSVSPTAGRSLPCFVHANSQLPTTARKQWLRA